jgi:hypothetical protein
VPRDQGDYADLAHDADRIAARRHPGGIRWGAANDALRAADPAAADAAVIAAREPPMDAFETPHG